MAAPRLRRRLQALGICCSAAALFMLSFALTLSAFVTWHFFSTRPYHTLPFHFELVHTARSREALQGYVSLSHERGLRSVQELTASAHLLLPESRVNLENSVFHVSAELFGRPPISPMLNATKRADNKRDELCLARGCAQATLKYRSPVYRAIRAVVMAGPLLLGLAREYQTVRVETLFYRAAGSEDGRLPLLDGIRVRLYPAQVQVAEAKLRLCVVRRSFVSTMVRERRVSTFLVVVIGLWYAMLAGVVMLFAIAAAMRKAVGRLWRAAVGSGEDIGDIGEVSEQVSEVSVNRPRVCGAVPEEFGVPGKASSQTVGLESTTGVSSIEREGLRRRASSTGTSVT